MNTKFKKKLYSVMAVITMASVLVTSFPAEAQSLLSTGNEINCYSATEIENCDECEAIFCGCMEETLSEWEDCHSDCCADNPDDSDITALKGVESDEKETVSHTHQEGEWEILKASNSCKEVGRRVKNVLFAGI